MAEPEMNPRRVMLTGKMDRLGKHETGVLNWYSQYLGKRHRWSAEERI
jgi:hypothetical protein